MGTSRVAAFVALLLTCALPAHAGPPSEIASAFDDRDPFDIHTSITYEFSSRSAGIKRELVGGPGSGPDTPIPVVRDLVYASTEHRLIPRLELGVFTDLALSVELPIVLRRTSQLELDDGVDRGNSTVIGDGLLNESGFDADDPGGPGFGSGALLFRGADRAGLDQIHLGVTWAPMNQVRDWTKPTWKIGAEVRLSIGEIARFDPADPDSESGVSRGVHDVKLFTSLARRRGWAEPFVEVFWLAAFAKRNGAPLDDPDQRFGARITEPQQRAGTRFGFEAIFFERPEDKQRVSLDLAATVLAHFEGREYSQMWEVFALAGDATLDGPLVLDADPVTPGRQAISHPGVSNVQNYLTLGGTAGLRAELGEKVRVGALFSLLWDQEHVISFADAGNDLPTCGPGVSGDCESEVNDVVNAGTQEQNPLHSDVIDVVGHRFRVNEAVTLAFMVDARFLF